MNSFMTKFRFALIACVGIFVLVMGGIQKKNELKKPIDILDPEFSFEDIQEGDHVKCDVDFIMDVTSYYTKNGKETSRIYCLPHVSEDDYGFYMDGYMGVTVAKNTDFSKLDLICNDSNNWWNDDSGKAMKTLSPYKLDGTVRKLSSEELEYFEKYIKKIDGDTDMIIPYTIVPNNNQGNLLLGVGGVITVIGSLLLVISIASDNKAKKRASEAESIPGYEDALL
ncbi:MAG: hypothetical protein MJ093_07780 [Saccharofermentans sp.]|nr:hypothetical protein [Saccharofermentans sp.]